MQSVNPNFICFYFITLRECHDTIHPCIHPQNKTSLLIYDQHAAFPAVPRINMSNAEDQAVEILNSIKLSTSQNEKVPTVINKEIPSHPLLTTPLMYMYRYPY